MKRAKNTWRVGLPHVARLISDTRIKRDIPQSEVADALLLGQAQYSKIERGQSRLTLRNAVFISLMLGISGNDLLLAAIKDLQSEPDHYFPEIHLDKTE